jgi:hypothetical protein
MSADFDRATQHRRANAAADGGCEVREGGVRADQRPPDNKQLNADERNGRPSYCARGLARVTQWASSPAAIADNSPQTAFNECQPARSVAPDSSALMW